MKVLKPTIVLSFFFWVITFLPRSKHLLISWLQSTSAMILEPPKITADGDCSHEIKRCLLFGRKGMTNLDNIQKQRHYIANKGPSSQGYGFSSSHVWMWELDYKESWAPKNWCFWTVMLEKPLESPLAARKLNQSSYRKSVLNIHWKDWCWSSNTFAI